MRIRDKTPYFSGDIIARVFLIFILLPLSAKQSWAQNEDLKEATTNLAQISSQAQLVILGENHLTTKLGEVVTEVAQRLSVQKPVDCLFFELSTDLQPALDQYAFDQNQRKFLRALYQTARPYQEKALEKIRLEIKGRSQDPQWKWQSFSEQKLLEKSVTLPFSSALLTWAKDNKVKLIAYDVTMKSPDFFASIYFGLLAELAWDRFFQSDKKTQYLKVMSKRNQIMANHIAESFQDGSCHRGLAVVGLDHLLSQKGVVANVGEELNYHSLGYFVQLARIQTMSFVLRPEIPPESGLRQMQFYTHHESMGYYDQLSGLILLPGQ